MIEQPFRRADAAVVVGVDGSPPSDEALRWAAHLAVSWHVPMTVVTVWHMPSVGFSVLPGDYSPESDAATVLDDSLGRVTGGRPDVTIQRQVAQGNPAQVLIDTSRDAQALIVGHRGRGGFPGLRLGSVSSACVAHALCPVLVVRAPEHPAG